MKSLGSSKTERIQHDDGSGYEIAWTWHEACASFEVRALDVAEDVGGRASVPSDEVHLRGYVRWDKCNKIKFAPDRSEHSFGDYWWEYIGDYWWEYMELLSHLYVTAFDLMGVEPDEHCDAEGLQVYRAAVAARDAIVEPSAAETPLSRYQAALRRLADFPASRSHMEETRLDELVGELDVLFRPLSPAERAAVEHPPLRR